MALHFAVFGFEAFLVINLFMMPALAKDRH